MESARFVTREGERRPGVSRRVRVPAPAAGQDWAVSVPGGVYWRPLLIRAQLAASGAVANRQPRLIIGDGSQTIATLENPANVAAGQTIAFTWIAGGFGASAGVSGLFPALGFPLLAMESGFTIATATGGFDVGDQWSGVVLTIDEFYETARGLSERVEEHELLAEAIARRLRLGLPVE